MSEYDACGGCSAEPVDPGPDASEISRRTFLMQSAFFAAAAALAACSVGGADSTAPNIPTGTTIKVSDFSALSADNGVAVTSLSGAPVAIVRLSATSYVVLSRVCPHQGGIVNRSGSGFLCPNHGAQFSLTGQWQGGQRTTNLHSYSTSFDASTGVLSIS
jgi:cytochrome b6-f complex iron-sulfur subunit